MKNQVREIREAQLMSKAELARKAGVSPVTIDRIEGGAICRMATKRTVSYTHLTLPTIYSV